ncbi:hypothetical protein ALC56_04598 [Trachymyrmex septentrionalis]|uniref:Uncharacterized protein n=1 Tax=Trachymyrmex septentrionalis TaxID=34720 RepID=A0A195FK10_9HYME|nr:hypothetical protein ALC56_04598 [Trachymyrmex septentrionalis]
MREVKVCKYHLIAESCSWVVHRACNTSAGLSIAVVSNGRSVRVLQTISANLETCDTRKYVETILGPFRPVSHVTRRADTDDAPRDRRSKEEGNVSTCRCSYTMLSCRANGLS